MKTEILVTGYSLKQEIRIVGTKANRRVERYETRIPGKVHKTSCSESLVFIGR